MSREMLINTVEGHECRIAVVQDGLLDELYVERVSSASRVGNIYKGRITNVEPAIQAAFVDFGAGKNGFLHISDLSPTYFPRGQKGSESVGRKRPHYDRPPIQECLRRGQEVIVQMTKEGIGTKGPTMTTYLSIPGRLLVMMPGMSRLGVSRKVQDDQARQQARAILQDLTLPPDMGFILRTAGLDRSKRDLQRDLNYLTRLWKSVSQRIKTSKAPAEIYQESDLVIRTIRDVYNADIDRIICDSQSVALKVREFLGMAMPRTKHTIELYTGRQGLYHEFALESEIEKVFCRRVELKSGGWLAIDQAEALVAIDVNSGRFREHSDAETTALKINQEAAVEIARQLRLRDLGGVVIIDFIDMREERNNRAVEKTLRDAIKVDRAKTKVLKISPFGIVEMTRQRVRPSLRDSIYRRCSVCDGTGLIKSEESQALDVLRNAQRAIANDEVALIEITVSPMVAHHLSNYHRREISEMEAGNDKRIIVRADATIRSDEARFSCTNNRGGPVAPETPAVPAKRQSVLTVNIDQLAGAAPSAAFEETDLPEEGDESIQPIETPVLPSAPAAIQAPAGGQMPVLYDPQAEQGPAETPAVVPQAPTSPTPEAQPAAPAQGTPEGQPGQGKKRRRGRRGGQRHRRHNEAQAGAQPEGQGQPAVQAQRPQPDQRARQGQRPARAQPSAPAQGPAATAAKPAEPFTAPPARPEAQSLPQAPLPKAQAPAADAPVTTGQADQSTGPETAVAGAPADGKKRRRGHRGGRRHRRKKNDPEQANQSPADIQTSNDAPPTSDGA